MITRNAWPLPDGSLAVRPGMRALGRTTSNLLAGMTLGESRNLIAYDDQTVEYSNDPVSQAAPTNIQVANGADLGRLTAAVVQNQLVLCAPGMAPLFGYLGGDLETMRKPSRGSIRGLTTITPPSDFCCAWAGRAVLGDRWSICVSDPLLPRAYTAQNVIIPVGGHDIHRVHSVAGGALAIVTTDAVWMMDRTAAATGARVAGSLERVTSYRSFGHGSTVVAGGRLWGLVPEGIRLIDAPGGPVINVCEGPLFGRRTGRLSFDMTAANLYALDSVVFISTLWGVCAVDTETGFVSWWSLPLGRVVGAGRDELGHPVLFCTDDAVRLYGSVDNASTRTAQGGVALPMTDGRSQVGRHVHVRTDGNESFVAGRNATTTATHTALAPVLGTADWSTATLAESELSSERHDMAQFTDEHVVEAGATGPLARFAIVDRPEATTITPERP